ncbi:MAG: hypothetical protein KatS3mg068_1496 [Candidatus Sericytochromatia bacterium]|nr:MAG: hypothetical protein KatS3mg068_1496 [Candidatus Sericytochromatia bacterium]
MACTTANSKRSGVVTPLFRIRSKGGLFQEPGGIIQGISNLFRKSSDLIFLPISKEFLDFFILNAVDIKEIFRAMGSGKYIFCSIKTPASFKLLENETFTVNEKFRKVEVVTNVKKVSDINIEMHFFHYNRRSILEYLFFVTLYRYRAYTTFDVLIDFTNNYFTTIFSYDFIDCSIKSAEIFTEQEFDEFGNVISTKSKPFKLRLTLIPYDVKIRI